MPSRKHSQHRIVNNRRKNSRPAIFTTRRKHSHCDAKKTRTVCPPDGQKFEVKPKNQTGPAQPGLGT